MTTTMTVEDITRAFEHPAGKFPYAAVEEAVRRRDEVTGPLLGILEDIVQRAQTLARDDRYMAHYFALYLLAQFRETRAYPLVVQLARLEGKLLDTLLGDFITDGLPEVLASVCGGNLDPIKALIEDDAVEEFTRSGALCALQIRFAAGDLSREDFVRYLAELWRGRLTREPSFIWNALVSVTADMYPDQFMDDIARAFDEGLADEFHIDLKNVLDIASQDRMDYISRLPQNAPVYVQDVIEEMDWWDCFRTGPRRTQVHHSDKKRKQISHVFYLAAFPNGYSAPITEYPPSLAPPPMARKVGPNEPCPCCSGKKYKKCCGRLSD